jgi:hypothetical protein
MSYTRQNRLEFTTLAAFSFSTVQRAIYNYDGK